MLSSTLGWINTDPHPKVMIHGEKEADDHRQLSEELNDSLEIPNPPLTTGLLGAPRGYVLPHVNLAVCGRSCVCTDNGVDSVSAMGLSGKSASVSYTQARQRTHRDSLGQTALFVAKGVHYQPGLSIKDVYRTVIAAAYQDPTVFAEFNLLRKSPSW